MCEPGKPCPGASEAAIKRAMQYLDANREGIKKAFEATFASHPAVKSEKVQKAMAAMPDGTAKLKDLMEQFYLKGMMDLIINGATSIDGEPMLDEDEMIDGLDKLSNLIDALRAAKEHFRPHVSAQGFNSVDDIDFEVPEGMQLDECVVINQKTGKQVKMDVRGKSMDEVRKMVAEAARGTEKADG